MRGHERATVEPADQPSRSPLPWLAAALLLLIATIAVRWPGVVMHDSIEQYGQALTGDYDDWHPPIMARTWALLNHVHAGSGPFFLIQMALWWGGLGLLAAALGRQGRHKAAALVLLVGVVPLWLGWATVVLKDAQMACCLVMAAGLAALDPPPQGEGGVAADSDMPGACRSREAGSRSEPWRRSRWWRGIPARIGALHREGDTPPSSLRDVTSPFRGGLIVVLILYATLVRGNAAFATVPFALALFDWGGLRRWPARIATLLVLTAAVLAASGPINRGLLGAERSHVERFLPFYDLVGIAHFAPLATLPGLAPGQWAEAERRRCYTPFYWDSYGDPAECGFISDALETEDDRHGGILRTWANTVVHHPVAYAHHRIVQLNANLRFWVGPNESSAVPPLYSEGNALGLGEPPVAAARALTDSAALMAASPLGWPILWFALALGLLWASRGDGRQIRLGRALALSTVCMSASFAVVSLASDLRYHLWSMVAAALALILLADARALDRRRTIAAGGILLALTAIAVAGHAGLAPPVYQPQPMPARS